MTQIETTLTVLNEDNLPQEGQPHQEFRTKANWAWNTALPTLIAEINDIITPINLMIEEMNEYNIQCAGSANAASVSAATSTSKASEAGASAAAAELAADRAESVVIPTEATYSMSAIDEMLSMKDSRLELELGINLL